MIGDLLKSVNTLQLVLVLVGLLVVRFYIGRASENRKIRSLGLRAPVRRAWPFGLDIAYEGVMTLNRHNTLEYFNEGMDNWGNPNHPYTIEFRVGTERIIITKDDMNIKAILAAQFNDYGKGEKFNQDWHEFLGDSIFSTDGDMWHTSRQLIRPQFIKDRLSDIKIFEKHSSTLAGLLKGPADDSPVDVLDIFFRYTLDAATDFILGRSVNSLNQGQTSFATAFNYIQHYHGVASRIGDFSWVIPKRRYNRELKVLNAFVEPFIEDALRLSPEELEKRTKSDEGYTFLHALASHTRDRTVLRDQLIAVLLAGRDTTAATLTWLFYEISTKPAIVKKLRDEILRHVGPTKTPTYEDLKSMKYLQHCMNETLRLYPSVPFNVRLALKDTTLPHGGGADGLQPVGILKGTPIGYSALAMQRRKDIYPPASSGFPPIEEFVPERWDNWTPKPWTYIPFNGGPRICIGQQFALTEMAYTITRIFQRFERVENYMTEKPLYRTDIIISPSIPVMLKFYKVTEKV